MNFPGVQADLPGTFVPVLAVFAAPNHRSSG